MFNTRIITCALAAAGVFFVGSQATAPQPFGGPSVTVVNTPLPVTVTNQTTPPSTVNIGNTPSVNVSNTTALATALAKAVGVGTPVVFSLPSLPSYFPVPLGQRLVIEYVSGFVVPPLIQASIWFHIIQFRI